MNKLLISVIYYNGKVHYVDVCVHSADVHVHNPDVHVHSSGGSFTTESVWMNDSERINRPDSRPALIYCLSLICSFSQIWLPLSSRLADSLFTVLS